jgi:hypothetical protein
MAQSAVGAFQAGLRERPENLDFPVGRSGSCWNRAGRSVNFHRNGEVALVLCFPVAPPHVTVAAVPEFSRSTGAVLAMIEARAWGLHKPHSRIMQRACRDFRRKKRQPKTLANDVGIIIRGGGQLLDGKVATLG